MANLRKLLAGDLTGSSLKESPLREVPLDRVYALGHADSLGSSLWRLKYAHDASAHQKALAILSVRCMSLAPTFELRNRFCRTVLQEWMDDNCRTCGGRRFMVSDLGVRGVCSVCDGTGLKRYSDQWRMRQMAFDERQYRAWERKFAKAHEKIADADLACYRAAAEQLGWIPTRAEEQKYLEKYSVRATLRAVTADDEGAKLDYMPGSLVSSAAG